MLFRSRGSGCPSCNKSKGELYVKSFLEKNNIIFISQKKFDECTFKKELIFDFYIPDRKICIEYDGEQHFKPIKFYGGLEKFNIQKMKDEIKNNFCENNNLRLIRLSYKDSREKIENSLKYEIQI